MSLRSILLAACALPLLMASPVLAWSGDVSAGASANAGVSGSVGKGGADSGVGGGTVGGYDASPSGAGITTPSPVPGPAPGGRMDLTDPDDFGSFTPHSASGGGYYVREGEGSGRWIPDEWIDGGDGF